MTGKRIPATKPEKMVRAIVRRPARFHELTRGITPASKDRLIAFCAKNGDFEPLADALRLDDEIGPLTRAFLIEDFEAGKPRKRGNKASLASLQSDIWTLWAVACVMVDHQVAKPKAISIVADAEGRARSTVQSAVARTEQDLPELLPREIDGQFSFGHFSVLS